MSDQTKPEYRSPIQMVFTFIRPFWKRLLLLVILLLGTMGLATLQPLVMAPMIDVVLNGAEIFAPDTEADVLEITDVNLNNADEYVGQVLNLGEMEPWDIVLLLSATYLGIVILLALIELATFYLFTWVRIQAYRNLQGAVFGHLLRMSMGYFNLQRSGEIVSRLNQDTHNSVTNLTSIIRTMAVAPITIAFYGLLLIRTNLELMALVTLIGVLQWLVARSLRTRLRKLVIDEFDVIARVNAYLHEVFQNVRVVKSFVAEKAEGMRLRSNVDKLIPIHIRRALFRHWQDPIVAMINGAASIGILILSARELLNGNLTIPGFFLFLYLGRAMIPPVTQLGQAYLSIQEMGASAERVYQIMEMEPDVIDGPQVISRFTERIEFEEVSFSYGQELVLKSINLDIRRGQMIALVGPSGAGKSTITDLLLRLYDPTAGKIAIDGIDLKQLNINSFRKMFGVVAQEPLLFNATIAENIAYGREGISKDDIEAAAKVANAAEFIKAMPKGYDTFVGDRGIRISGGQRQRVAIARAVVHKPQILVLDEATSSLDTESERLVQDAIDRVIQDTTAVVVAHRLSTVIHADKIIVLDKGRIVDQGKHSVLYKRCALYKRLCELQFTAGGTELRLANGHINDNKGVD